MSDLKNVAIPAELHDEIKTYCKDNGLVMGVFVKKMLRAVMDQKERFVYTINFEVPGAQGGKREGE